MLRKIVIAGLIMVAAVVMTAAYVLRTPEAASGEIEPIPLLIEATQTEGATTVEATVTAETAATTSTRFQIDPAASQVRFELDEDLRGSRITVVGVTDQVAGEIGLNFDDLSQTQVGIIQINARTLATDNNLRNRAIQNEILETGQYEYITSAPTAVTGLPDSVQVGDTVNFNIEGELTIRDVTQPVTFAVQAVVLSETEITGVASTVIARDTYGLAIPSVPNVANVEQEVELIIDYTAGA